MSIFQQFLYTREINFKQYMLMNPQTNSNKKAVDAQIFNKFAHISNQSDKKTIYDTQILSGKVQANEVKKKMRTIQNAEKFFIKTQDEIELLDLDPQKQKFTTNYRKSIFKMAMGKRKRNIDSRGRMNSTPSFVQSTGQIDITTEFIQDTIIQKEKIKLKIKQKLTLILQNDKIKEVQQLGQIIVQGTQKQNATLILSPSSLWANSKVLSKRISPNSLQINQVNDLQYQFFTAEGYKSKPLIDYVMKTDTFNQDKIPLLFIYQMEVNSSNIQFTFKYKMNEKWKHKIFELDINVYLNKDFIVLDCKSIPAANSLKNNKVTWKTKQISPNSNNSKGKILLAFSQAKFPPKQILAQIRLNMRCSCGLIQNLNAEVKQDFNQISSGDKTLLIQYRIAP